VWDRLIGFDHMTDDAAMRNAALERKRRAEERERRAVAAQEEHLRLAELAETPMARQAHRNEAERHGRAAALQRAAIKLQAEHARQHPDRSARPPGARDQVTPDSEAKASEA
jgi:hypothetical protein